ncbi:MAG: phosphoribosyl-ATP diphosphatase [Alphaproteobacteria bacterium]
MSRFSDILDRLTAVIAARKALGGAESWTTKLLADPKLAAKKLSEEAMETALATSPEETAAESADLIYHWLVLLAARGVSLDEVAAKLEAREGVSGIAEKAGRK